MKLRNYCGEKSDKFRVKLLGNESTLKIYYI